MIAKRLIQRRGFTIVELLVAMALIILIMAVLSEAFVAGLSAFRSLKAIGDLQERLRLAAVKLRQDLAARHFEGDRKLSDNDPYWQDPFIGNGDQNNRGVGGRPSQGFFRIQTPPPVGSPLGTTGYLLEGTDGDLIPSYIVNPAVVVDPNTPRPTLQIPGPILHFASKLVPDRKDALRRELLYTSPVPAGILDVTEGPPDFRTSGILNSPWAEIAWFLVPTGEFAGSTPLYSLHRRARLMIAPRRDEFLSTAGAVASAQIGNYYGVSCEVDPTPGNILLLFNTEGSVAEQPYVGRAVARSMMRQPNPPAYLADVSQWVSDPFPIGRTQLPTGAIPEPVTLLGDDLVTTDVISFEIKVLRPRGADFQDLNEQFLDGGGNLQWAYPGGIYDSAWSPQGWLSLRAIKVTIRVWDFKTQQARQVSIIQDL